MSTSETISAVGVGIALLTLGVATGTFIKAIIEYKRQNAVKRFEIFQAMNERFDGEKFVKIRELLDDDSLDLESADYTEKHNFLGFFEELAISVNSRVMSEEVAFYLFGYYAIRCWRSENFWVGDMMIDKESIYWLLFRDFAKRMEKMEDRLGSGGIDTSKMRF
jgi:hypothetical protein